MNPYTSLVPAKVRQEVDRIRLLLELRLQMLWSWLQRRWPMLLGSVLLIYLFTHRDIQIDFAMARASVVSWPWQPWSATGEADAEASAAQNVSLLTRETPAEPPAAAASKRQRQLAYVREYAAYAQEEMRDHQIPASITLAQALLESNIGESRLARENNNHFGIKCFSRTCQAGHCSNYSDDSHKDFFRIFDSPKESFHAHSQILQKPRYRRLFRLDSDDYRGWARGLSQAGYATDPRYADKLIKLIEDLGLDRYDG
ncbi:MAG: glucosaminidase domain-containing protein [Lewinella sp.]|nr:glucosaminidase domain-containing protein [Lewinella sp.]